MEQNNANSMVEFASSDSSVGVPHSSFKRIFVGGCFSPFQHFCPCCSFRFWTSYVVHRNFWWPVRKKQNYVKLNSVFAGRSHVTYNSFICPKVYAMVMSPFIAKSTGITSALYSPLHSIDLITPLPPATMIPTGPFKLSTHPSTGSLLAGVTVIDTFIL